jgi:hypothetical protein
MTFLTLSRSKNFAVYALEKNHTTQIFILLPVLCEAVLDEISDVEGHLVDLGA